MDIDLVSPDQWIKGVPHEQFAWLRREAPVFWHRSDDPAIPDFWALTCHADVQSANRDAARFSSQRGGVFLNIQTDEERDLFRSIIETDEPAHTRLRRLVNRGFTPRAISHFADSYRAGRARRAGGRPRARHLRLGHRCRHHAARLRDLRAPRRSGGRPPTSHRVDEHDLGRQRPRVRHRMPTPPSRQPPRSTPTPPSWPSNAAPTHATTS